MKKIFFLTPIIFLLFACTPEDTDFFWEVTSNITDDSLWTVTHQYLDFNTNFCRIPAAFPQTPPLNTASPYYVPSKYECYSTQSGGICGYDCKIAAGRIKCGYLPAQRCMVGSSGYIACGYDCKRTWREANCGIRYGDTCVITQAQGVICGLNCRVVDGYVKCQDAPTFRAYFPQTNWP